MRKVVFLTNYSTGLPYVYIIHWFFKIYVVLCEKLQGGLLAYKRVLSNMIAVM